jgi:hypothetical protein
MADWGDSDIATGIEIARWICEHGFVQENRADIRYAILAKDVLNFRYLLQRLDEALRDAHKRYEENRLLRGWDILDPAAEGFELERKSIAGDFVTTLTQCTTLLTDNKKIRQQYSHALQNPMQCLAQLRRRLDFHSTKIRLVVDRLAINLLTDHDAKLDDTNVKNNDATDAHAASQAVLKRLNENLHVNAPCAISEPPNLPLPAAFDALFFHFDQSTDGPIESTDGPVQTPQKYLALLKTRWLLEHIRNSHDYLAAVPGYYYKRAINQIEQATILQIQQEDLIRCEESVLLDLPQTCFQIWPTPDVAIDDVAIDDVATGPPPLMPGANEELAASIKLAPDDITSTENVTIFKRSDNQFRTVRETTYPLVPDDSYAGQRVVHVSRMVHVSQDSFIPRYALPTQKPPCREIAILSHDTEALYRFKTMDDLKNFQAAFMGYQLSYDHEGSVLCQFGKGLSHLDCKARIQLWQDPIGPDGTTAFTHQQLPLKLGEILLAALKQWVRE